MTDVSNRLCPLHRYTDNLIGLTWRTENQFPPQFVTVLTLFQGSDKQLDFVTR